jgi:hypothetical protein
MDPYHIMERRGRFRGSLWLGMGGLRWLVNEILKLRNLACTLEGFFEFFRNGYRVLEISCLSNRGGRFLDISEYHSGARRGSIRLPEGRRGAGWSLFEFQVRKFFLCEIVIPEQHVAPPRMTAEKPPVVEPHGKRNAQWVQTRQQRKPRNNNPTRSAILPKSVMIPEKENSESRVPAAKKSITPRPTRSTKFEWKPKSRTIRITLNMGSRRTVEWVGLETPKGPIIYNEASIISGPKVSENNQTQRELVGPSGTEPTLVNRIYIGESSGTKDEDMESTPCDENDILESEPEDTDGLSDSDTTEIDEELLGTVPVHESPLPSPRTVPVEPSRCTVDPTTTSSSVISPVTEIQGDAENQLSMVICPQTDEYIAEMGRQMEDFPEIYRLEDLWISGSSSGYSHLDLLGTQIPDENQSPLSCAPLARIDPGDFEAFTRGYTGDVLALEEAMSAWVEQKYKVFSKLVGMALLGFEGECISLLRRIDAERKKMRAMSGPRCTTSSVKKGKRELRNLVSSVNYEGRKVTNACS